MHRAYNSSMTYSMTPPPPNPAFCSLLKAPYIQAHPVQEEQKRQKQKVSETQDTEQQVQPERHVWTLWTKQ